MLQQEETPYARVLRELAESRGMTLEEVAEQLHEATQDDFYRNYTVAQLTGWPPVGYGADLDRVLHFSAEEEKVMEAFGQTFFGR
jgi:hypothetical protein